MDITVKRSGIACCEKVFEQSVSLEEAAEAVVPDTQPDAEYILCADGEALIRSKDVLDGRVNVSAQVEAVVLYAPEGGDGVCSLDVAVPVTVELEAPDVTPDSLATASLTVTGIEARLLNPRKVIVRCMVCVELQCWNRGELRISSGLEGEDAGKVETLTESCTISPVVCVREKTFVVSDEYQLQPGLLPIGTVLGGTVEIRQGGVRSVGSRLLFSGAVRLDVLYLSAGGSELCSAQFESEYSQMLDADTELACPDCCVYSVLTAKYIEPVTLAGGEKGISAEYHIVSQCVCTDSVRAQCLTDCYSNSAALELGYERVDGVCVQRRANIRAAAHEQLPASPQPVSICRTSGCLGIPECADGMLRCAVTVTVLYTASDGKVYSAKRRLTCEAPSELGADEYAAGVGAACAECTAVITQGGFDLRAVVDFELLSAKRLEFMQLESVADTEAEENESRPSVTVIRAAQGDTLWSLGKKYHSTPALITSLNGLEEGDALAGRVLLIPYAGK